MPYRTSRAMTEHKAEMRAALLAAAQALFATQGYANTTMQQIVTKAGTSIGNCYFYFPDKAAILMALFEGQMQEIGQTVDAAIAATPAGVGQLAVAVYMGVVVILAQPEVARIVLIEINQPTVRERAMEFFVDRVRRFFRVNGEFVRGIDAELAAQAWQGALFQVMLTALAGNLPNSADEIGRFMAHWNLQALGLSTDVVEAAMKTLDTYRSARD